MGRFCLRALPDGKVVANWSFWDRKLSPPLKHCPTLSCHPQRWNPSLPSLGIGNPESKYFRFCRPDSLCCNIQFGYFSKGSQVQGINKGMWLGSNKTLFTQASSWKKAACKPSFSYALPRIFLCPFCVTRTYSLWARCPKAVHLQTGRTSVQLNCVAGQGPSTGILSALPRDPVCSTDWAMVLWRVAATASSWISHKTEETQGTTQGPPLWVASMCCTVFPGDFILP